MFPTMNEPTNTNTRQQENKKTNAYVIENKPYKLDFDSNVGVSAKILVLL